MFGITIPVVSLLPNGSETTDTVAGKPCVRMGLTFQFSESGSYQIADISHLNGHIDTGCDFTVIDEALLIGRNSPIIKEITITTLHATSVLPVHRATLFFFGPNQNLAQETEFVAAPISADEPYRIILGRSFLQQASFIYNGDKGISKIAIGSSAPTPLEPKYIATNR